MRCDGSSSLGQREKSADELVSRIPGDMGETHELSGSRHSLRHELAQLISCDSLGGWIGKLRELLKYDPRSVSVREDLNRFRPSPVSNTSTTRI